MVAYRDCKGHLVCMADAANTPMLNIQSVSETRLSLDLQRQEVVVCFGNHFGASTLSKIINFCPPSALSKRTCSPALSAR